MPLRLPDSMGDTLGLFNSCIDLGFCYKWNTVERPDSLRLPPDMVTAESLSLLYLFLRFCPAVLLILLSSFFML